MAALAAGEGDDESGLVSSTGCQCAEKKHPENKYVLAANEGFVVVPEPILFLVPLVT